MNRHAAALLTLAAMAAPALAGPAGVIQNQNAVPGQYIVVLQQGVVRGPEAPVIAGPSVAELASHLGLAHGGKPGRSFQHAMQGFVMKMSAADAEALARDPRVAFVEEDAFVTLEGAQADPPSWGLDRIDQRQGLDGLYSFSTAASGVHAFVIDTGILSTHVDFEGRVDTSTAFTAIADGNGTEDCFGHGTHVAATLGGASYGVAKEVTLHPVRVASCSGSGTISGVIAGVDWITSIRSKGRFANAPAVVNVSLGGLSLSLEAAVSNSIQQGTPYVFAAGNNGADRCSSPILRLPEVIVAGASDSQDLPAALSNYGSCVDLFAPGMGIPSAFIRSDTDSLAMSGTSSSAPHVAGAAALYLADNPKATPAEVQDAILGIATPNQLAPTPDGLVPLLLYSRFDAAGGGADDPPVASFAADCNASRRTCSFDARASSDDHGIAAYDWDFGDGTSGTGKRARHAFPSEPASAVFPVTLFVTDTAGQVSTAQQDVVF